MKILGIDPAAGKPNAYCIFENDRVIEWGKFKDYETYQDIIIRKMIKHVFIEDQYLGINFNAAKKLIEVQSILKYIAESLGCDVKLIHPKSWMSAIRIPVQARRGQERDQWIITLSKSLINGNGFFKLSIDEACAIQIAYYGARRLKKSYSKIG